jgi:hypothetical protein
MGNSEILAWVWFLAFALGLFAWVYVDTVWVYPWARKALREGRPDDAFAGRTLSYAVFGVISFGVGWFGITLFDLYDLTLVWPF